jgi:hypothetical protein
MNLAFYAENISVVNLMAIYTQYFKQVSIYFPLDKWKVLMLFIAIAFCNLFNFLLFFNR